MRNKSSNIHNIEINSPYDKELAKKKLSISSNPFNKKIKDLNLKNNLNNKKELKGQNNDQRKKKQSVNNKISKDLKNKFDIKENEDHILKHQKRDFKQFKINIDNNELYKEEDNQNKNKNQSEDEKKQNILINSINEIRLPRQLMDISCDLLIYE